jgi:excisionase family DNA binding protein
VVETNDKLLNWEEAAELLGLKPATVRRLTYTHELPCVRPTGKRCVRYRRKDLEALIRLRSQPLRVEGRHRPGRCKGQPDAEEHLETLTAKA